MQVRPGESTQASYLRQRAAVGEGFCPDHETPLTADGYCVSCAAWWWQSVPEETVTQHYYHGNCRRGQCGRVHGRLP